MRKRSEANAACAIELALEYEAATLPFRAPENGRSVPRGTRDGELEKRVEARRPNRPCFALRALDNGPIAGKA